MGRLLLLLALSFAKADPAADRAQAMFKRLLAASGSPRAVAFKVREPVDDPQSVDYVDSSFGADLQVRVSRGFLDVFGGDELALMATLAHETGHVVQDSEDGVLDKLEAKYGGKRLESQADLLGAKLARKLDYSAADYLAGRERKFGCELIKARGDDRLESHPTRQDQWVNILLYQQFGRDEIELFDENGALRPSRLLGKPDAALDYFIEAAGSRGSMAQVCGQPGDYVRLVDGVRNRLERARAGLPW